MFHRLILRARYLTMIPVLGLLGACLALYVRGLRLVLQQFHASFFEHADHLNNFEVEILEGIDLLLVGTGCLLLAIGMFTLFVRELELPRNLRFRNFHEVKGLFANFVILAMAIAFLEQFNSLREADNPRGISGADVLFSGAGMALVTLSLLAFKYWGGDRAMREQEPDTH